MKDDPGVPPPRPSDAAPRAEAGSRPAPGKADPGPQSPLPEAIARELEELRARAVELDALRQKAKERDDFLALAQRVQADFANYQKRMAEEKDKWMKFLVGELFRDLLPAVDAFDACATTAQKGGDPQHALDGFRIALKELVRILDKNGLKAVAPADEEFDPARHEAVGVLETADLPENRIGELMRKGYLLHDRLLRPAQVRVTRKPPADEKKAEDE